MPVQMPEWPVSATTTAFGGRNSVISLQMRSGRMGIASESRIGATSSRHPLTSSCTRRTHSALGAARLQDLEQPAQRDLGIAQQTHGIGIVAAQLLRIDIQLDHRRADGGNPPVVGDLARPCGCR